MSSHQQALETMFTLIGKDSAMMAELIASYLDETPLLLTRLRNAAATGDARALALAAHTLKSTARDFGADELSDLCALLEANSRTSTADNQIAAIAQALEMSHSALGPWRNHYETGGAARGDF